MGSSQSRVADQQVQQTLVDRLRALEAKRVTDVSEKEGYVYVGSSSDGEARTFHRYTLCSLKEFADKWFR